MNNTRCLQGTSTSTHMDGETLFSFLSSDYLYLIQFLAITNMAYSVVNL